MKTLRTLCILFFACASALARQQPNILFFMADDWSYPHAGAYGDPVVKTPAFDRVAREGVLFDNAYASAPSCTPSRHAIVSGQCQWRLKGGMNLGGSIPAETPMYPALLADAGYTKGFARKGAEPSKQKHKPFGERFKNFGEFYKERKKDQPFCFWYGAGEPHRPYEWESSKRAGMDLKSIKLLPGLPDNDTTRTDVGDYYMKVQRFDRDVAAMIAMLEKDGELENTIIVISGDNGMPFPRCKATLYNTGTRVPLAIRWGDKVKGARRVADFVSLTDLAPTFLEAAGVEIPAEMTGRSLLKMLTTGESESARDHVLTGMDRHVYAYPSRAIRTAEFLYIRNFAPASWYVGAWLGKEPPIDFVETPWPARPGAFSFNIDPSPTKQWMRERGLLNYTKFSHEELYDLKSDPGQLNNVAADPAYRAARDRLSLQLTQELRESADPKFALSGHSSFKVEGWMIHLNEAAPEIRAIG
jgi:N-sulfoglucosamine sulfohydrolase